jgi:hypothetical protein
MSDMALCGSTCLSCGQSCVGEICSKCLEEVRPACICPELEDLSDGPGDGEEKRPSCPVHGAVLYGETQEDRDARQKALYPTLAEVFPDRPEYDKSAEDEECQF